MSTTGIKLTIDQREIEARPGETVLQAARRNGIDIPHFCYHDKLSIAGSCRICLVKVNNLPKLQPACNLAATPNMIVETGIEQVRKAREDVLQFLLVNHPLDCGICDKAGECRLQDYQHRYGPAQSMVRDPKHHKRKLHDLGPRITLDNERCILCSRCVRFTREISRSNALGIVERGNHAYVEAQTPGQFDDPYSDNVIDLCPTGALLSREFLYKCRVWFLQPVRSVCTGCARGCSIKSWKRMNVRQQHMPGGVPGNVVYRTTAFENPDINGPWLCNKGYDQHTWMARERVAQPLVAGQPATTGAAMAAAKALLASAKNPAVLVSSHASNEELDVLQSLAGGMPAYPHRDCVPVEGEVIEDALLIRADKNPNRRGVVDRFGDREFDPGMGHDVVIVWGEISTPLAVGTTRWIHLTPFGTPVESPAAVVLPISNTYERHGTFTNFEGKLNTFDPLFEKPAHVLHAADVFRSLAS
jgi:NADH-quinone oxidoreductase subunit G